jgi:MarR family transcriptional regulator for hemolysin
MPPSSPRRLPPLLRHAWYGLNQAFRQRIAHLGITPDQYTVLRWLHEGNRQGLTQCEITTLMSSDPNTIAAILKRMESAGLVDRRPHESDRRARRVRLKPAGNQAFQRARNIALGLQQEILNSLPGDDRTKFLKNLEFIATACQRAAEKNE